MCDAAHQKGDFAGEVNFDLCIGCISAFSQLENDTSFIKIDQGIQIIQLKKDRKFLLFS